MKINDVNSKHNNFSIKFWYWITNYKWRKYLIEDNCLNKNSKCLYLFIVWDYWTPAKKPRFHQVIAVPWVRENCRGREPSRYRVWLLLFRFSNLTWFFFTLFQQYFIPANVCIILRQYISLYYHLANGYSGFLLVIDDFAFLLWYLFILTMMYCLVFTFSK